MHYLKGNWDLDSPGADSIVFDTKFGSKTGMNYVIIEKMPTMMEYQVLGGSRTRFVDTYRIQTFCIGFASINAKFLIEQEIQRIINGSALGIQTVTINGTATNTGIEWAEIESFTEISTYNDVQITQNMMPKEPSTRARSYAIVHLYYDKVVQ